jgi:hypothetical protein
MLASIKNNELFYGIKRDKALIKPGNKSRLPTLNFFFLKINKNQSKKSASFLVAIIETLNKDL